MISKTSMIAGTIFFVTCASPGAFAQSDPRDNLRERVATAVEAVEAACGEDVKNFCGKVTRGGGRILLCMQAHEDQLSRRCQFTLYRASRRLENAVHHVERLADGCWNDIEAQCGDAERIGQCVVAKRESLSKSCQTVVGAIQKISERLAALKGMPVFSADNKNIGEVVEVMKAPDGTTKSIQIQVGRVLGLGDRVITLDSDMLEQLPDRIKAKMGVEQIQSLSQTPNR